MRPVPPGEILGVPSWLPALGCLVVATGFAVVRPRGRQAARWAPATVVLEWGHAAVWLLLAGACAADAGQAPVGAVRSIGAAAGAAYLLFLGVLLTARRAPVPPAPAGAPTPR